jgi:hypothetical protein
MGVSVRVSIDELVLTGLAPGMDADLVAASFMAELERLIRVRGVPRANRETEAVTGLPVVPMTGSPARVGTALARSVHAGLSRRGESR